MSRILATAGAEFRIALRNRWVAIMIVMMTLFSLVLSAAGSAPTGAISWARCGWNSTPACRRARSSPS